MANHCSDHRDEETSKKMSWEPEHSGSSRARLRGSSRARNVMNFPKQFSFAIIALPFRFASFLMHRERRIFRSEGDARTISGNRGESKR